MDKKEVESNKLMLGAQGRRDSNPISACFWNKGYGLIDGKTSRTVVQNNSLSIATASICYVQKNRIWLGGITEEERRKENAQQSVVTPAHGGEEEARTRMDKKEVESNKLMLGAQGRRDSNPISACFWNKGYGLIDGKTSRTVVQNNSLSIATASICYVQKNRIWLGGITEE